LYRIVLPTGALLFDEKIHQSASQPVIHARLVDAKQTSKHKIIFPAFFGDRFGGKDGGLCTHNPACQRIKKIGGIFVLSRTLHSD
jgi:hypothetical protein